MNDSLKLKLAFAFLLVFAAGAATGGFFGIHHLQHHFILGPPHSGDVGDRMREHFRHALGLTAEQEKKIAPILDATSAKLEAIRIETAERVRNVMEASKGEVAPLLTPEQQKKLEQLESEHRKALLHHGFLPPPPPQEKPSPPHPDR
jgi:Spy/CpxP family protein refolding chaperone